MKTENSLLFAGRTNDQVCNVLRYRHYQSPHSCVIKPKLLYATMLSLMPAVALAAPQSGEVVAGASTISTPDANTTIIQQTTDNSIINWQSFSIAGDEYVQYIQPNTSSISLNRVIGGNPSSILGSLSANGQVYLVNPSGIYFGANVRVDVSGIVASVLDINDQDFMAGNYSFSKSLDAPLGHVINDGLINARNQGYVVLMGDYTRNNGVIQAQMGEVVLASGSKITMDVSGNNLISVAVDEATVNDLAGVENTGEIYADGGRVIMTAKVANDLISTAVNNDGLVRANSIVEHDGAIFLTGIGGDISNSGTLDASAESGSGVDGGGVLVYSDRDITLSPGAVIAAQGDGNVSGGVIRVIAEEKLDHQSGAMIDVTSSSGDGGFVEVSGHGSIAVRGDIDIGQGGELLIDPASITLSTADVSVIATQLNAGADVTLVASNTFAATTGSPSHTISATNTGAGDLSIKIGTLAVGAGSLSSSGTFNCATNGFCVGGGTAIAFTPDANGNVNLATVNFILAGGLNVAGGTATGNVSLASINAGGNVTITSGTDITLANVSAAGTSLLATAGNNLSVNGGIGSTASPLAANVTLNANNNVVVNSDIVLATNSLNLTADFDGDGIGNVDINGSTGAARTVSTQGLLSVTGDNFNINGADFGTTTAVRIGIATALDVQANSISINIGNQLNINAGQVFVATSGSTGTRDVSVTVNASNDVNITAAGLSVQGGDIFASQSSHAGFVTARGNATLSAGNNVTIAVSGSLSVKGGSADGRASFYSSGSGKAFANASISAGNNVNVSNVGGVMTVAAGPATAFMTRVVEGTGSAVGQANAKIDATNITVTSAGSLNISRGGATAQIDGFSSGSYNATASANASLIATQAVNLNVVGDINLNGTVSNIASASVNSNDTGNYTVVANSNILVKGTDVTITTSNGGLSIAGGSASVSSVPTGGAGTHTVVSQASATAEISATQNVTINLAGTGKNLALAGGDGDASVNSYVCNNCSATADASVSINGNIVSVTVADGGLSILGGSAASASVDASGAAKAIVKTGSLLDASQGMTVNVSGNVNVQGGVALANGGNAFNAGVLNSSSATANASMVAGNDLTLDAGSLSVAGGTATATPGAGTNTRMTVASATAIIDVGGIASIDANAGGISISKGIETASPAVLPDVITVDSGVAVTVGSLNLSAMSTINATSAGISATGDASFNGGVTVAIDAASTLSVGGNLNITGGSFLNVDNDNYFTLGGTSLSLTAGNNLDINTGMGTSASRLNHDITLAAQNININQDIFLGNNTLTLTGNATTGSINIENSASNRLVKVSTLGTLSVTGHHLNVDNVLTGFSGVALSNVEVDANTIDVNINGNMTVQAGNFLPTAGASSSVSVNATVAASSNISVTAQNLSVFAGNANADASGGAGSITMTANAAMTAGGNLTVDVTNAFSVAAGSALASASGTDAASAQAHATVSAGGNLDVQAGSMSVTGGNELTSGTGTVTASAITSLNAGVVLSVVTVNNITLIDSQIVAGTNLTLAAGGNLDLSTHLGSNASRLNHDVTLVGQNININHDIYLGNHTLTLTGSTAAGSINIENSSVNRHVKVDTLGRLSVTGNNLKINNVLTGFSGTTFSSVGVRVDTIDVVINGDMTVQAGDFVSAGAGTPVSVDTKVVASGNISVSAQSLNVLAGNVNVTASGGGSPNPVSANAGLTAGGDLSVNVSNAFSMAAGSASANASSTDAATAQANSTVSAGSNLSIQAASATISGGTETTGGTGSVAAFATGSLSAGAGLSLVATGDITASKADISGSGVYISAGNNINLLTSSTTIGSGTVAGISGDSLLISTLSNEGISLPASNNPNAKLESGGTLTTGDLTVTGSNAYLWFSADAATINSITAPAAPLLVQYSPFTTANTIGVEDLSSLAEQTNYNNTDHFSTLPATTLVIGGAQQTGHISVGSNGVLDLGSKNIIFVNNPGIVNSTDNIITTGIVAQAGFVSSLASVFVNPRLENIDVDNSSWWLEEQERGTLLVENETDDSGMCTAL